jgi:hypothetical protein
MNNGIGSFRRLPSRRPREIAYFAKVTTAVLETVTPGKGVTYQAENLSGKNGVIMGNVTKQVLAPLFFHFPLIKFYATIRPHTTL